MEQSKEEIIQKAVDVYNERIEVWQQKETDAHTMVEQLIIERDNYIQVMQ